LSKFIDTLASISRIRLTAGGKLSEQKEDLFPHKNQAHTIKIKTILLGQLIFSEIVRILTFSTVSTANYQHSKEKTSTREFCRRLWIQNRKEHITSRKYRPLPFTTLSTLFPNKITDSIFFESIVIY
jgi:hypothetical protein